MLHCPCKVLKRLNTKSPHAYVPLKFSTSKYTTKQVFPLTTFADLKGASIDEWWGISQWGCSIACQHMPNCPWHSTQRFHSLWISYL